MPGPRVCPDRRGCPARLQILDPDPLDACDLRRPAAPCPPPLRALPTPSGRHALSAVTPPWRERPRRGRRDPIDAPRPRPGVDVGVHPSEVQGSRSDALSPRSHPPPRIRQISHQLSMLFCGGHLMIRPSGLGISTTTFTDNLPPLL